MANSLVDLFSKKEGNVLTLESFELLWRVHEDIKNIEADGLKWHDMCQYRSLNEECIVSGPTQFWSNNKTLYDLEVHTDEDLRHALSSPVYPSGQIVPRESIFGLFTTSEHDQLETAAGMSQTYNFNADFENTLKGGTVTTFTTFYECNLLLLIVYPFAHWFVNDSACLFIVYM